MSRTSALILLLLVGVSCCAADTACSHALSGKIIDDATSSAKVANARSQFLQTRPHPFSRCDITVLLPQKDGTFLRASYNQNELGYPASTVKLAYLVGAVHYCLSVHNRFDCLDPIVRPMIYTSDNFETGVVVDEITQSTNFKVSDKGSPEFQKFMKARNFTAAFLDSHGLLEDQIILSKTYPSNSGSMPSGAEALMREVYGQNLMKPKCAASLMAEIVTSNINPSARDYMLGMLQHARYSYSSIGMGTPPGSVLRNKIGNAYDTLEEVAYITLSNGYSFIMAIYTNGYEPQEPELNNLSYLAELIIDELGLSQNLPPKTILTAENLQVVGSGWSLQRQKADKFGDHYYQNSGNLNAAANWTTTLATNIYEVSVWSPQDNQFGSVQYTVQHANGVDKFILNQDYNGGRWVKLGDFNFEHGKSASVSVAPITSMPFYANAVKFAAWPSCKGVPGIGCIL